MKFDPFQEVLIHSPKKTLKWWIINENDSRDFQHNFHRPCRYDYIDFQKHILSFRRRKSSTAQNSTRVRVQFLYSIASDVFRNHSCNKTNRKKWNSTYFKSFIPFVQNNIEILISFMRIIREIFNTTFVDPTVAIIRMTFKTSFVLQKAQGTRVENRTTRLQHKLHRSLSVTIETHPNLR